MGVPQRCATCSESHSSISSRARPVHVAFCSYLVNTRLEEPRIWLALLLDITREVLGYEDLQRAWTLEGQAVCWLAESWVRPPDKDQACRGQLRLFS